MRRLRGTVAPVFGAVRGSGQPPKRRRNVRLILLIIVILLLLGALPTWPYSHSWGYYPSGGLGLILLIIILVMLFGGREI